MPRFRDVDLGIDEMREESRRNYEERRQIRMKLEKESKERAAARAESEKGTPEQQIQKRLVELKDFVSKIHPGDIQAMTKVLGALKETVEIVGYLFQRDAKGGNINYETAAETRESPGEQANAEGNSG